MNARWPGPPLGGDDLLILIRAVDLMEASARLTDLPFKAPNAELVERLNKIRTRLVHAYGYETISPPGGGIPADCGGGPAYPLRSQDEGKIPTGSCSSNLEA